MQEFNRVMRPAGDEPTAKKERSWSQNTVSVSVVDDAMRRLQISSDTKMSSKLGFRGNAISAWRKKGRAPAHVALACEGLVRRAAKDAMAPTTMLLKVEPDKLTVVESFLKAVNVEYRAV